MASSAPASPRREMPGGGARRHARAAMATSTDVRPGARCPVCGGRMVPTLDPGAADCWACPDPACPVTDDPSAWMGRGE
jgi:hypothetical protein